MADNQDLPADSERAAKPRRRIIAASVLRAAASVTAFVTIYYVLPLNTSVAWVAITALAVGLVVLVALVVFQVRWILTSPFPGLRALEALTTSIPLFLVLFAGSYVVMAHVSHASFGQYLTHTDALYFTVTVFTTVGFGDITAKSEAARILVTFQMIMDLVIIGLGIQAIVSAAKHGRQRRSAGQLARRSEHGDPSSRCANRPRQETDDGQVAVQIPRNPAQRHHDHVDYRLAERDGLKPEAHGQVVGMDDKIQQARGGTLINGQRVAEHLHRRGRIERQRTLPQLGHARREPIRQCYRSAGGFLIAEFADALADGKFGRLRNRGGVVGDRIKLGRALVLLADGVL